MIQPFRCELPPPAAEIQGLAWLEALEQSIEGALQAMNHTPVSLVRWAIVAIDVKTRIASIEGACWLNAITPND
jgi:hypothetical protein